MSRAGIRPEREERWQRVWEAHNIYRTPEHPKNGMYVLDMFPYPSAHGLHVGHPEGYTASDIYARYLRHRGRDVLHPMGFDSFGLPAENYAIKTGTHPAKTTADNIDNMRKQIKSLGFSYDWEREVITSDPKYYKWTQWIFVKLFEAGLAYEADAPINWCPRDLTGLANEEVVNGKCERCGTEVTKKKIKQWLVKITDEKYINRLLNDLDNLDWPENIKEMQRNWIGKSEGAECDFEVKDTKEKIRVFTTRPDTLFGATYMVLSPEHELVEKITTDEQKEKVQEYKKQASGKSDLERTELAKEKTGEFTGSYAINPVNGKDIPIWIADYVLATYGTGAIMAVPAHDERDYTFAKKFGLEIIEVVDVKNKEEGKATTGEGVAIHSGEFNGLTTKEFKEKIIQWLEKEGKGHRAVNYKMRDWLFSRQRYWGEPIPIVHCDTCKKKIEKEAHEIHFYNQQTWNKILSGKKTVETRALNPEEKERYFGDIRPGEYLKMKNMISGEIQYAEIIEAKTYKTLKSFMEDGDMFTGLSPDVAYADEKELEAAYQFTPDYVERIKKNGLVGWRIRLIQPGNVAVSENQLPLELPDVEKYEPTGTGESPLAHIDEWVNTTCPTCDGKAKRETNTMPQWAGSNWYFLRYTDPSNKKELADKKKINAWLPVEMYIGGAEHAVLHLLYARFIYKFLFDIGVIPKECGDEPFKTLKNQGLILGEDMQKMSKSRGNVVNPDDVINEYGADVMRMYEMFMGPFEDAKPWSMQGMVGVKRFLGKVESLYEDTIAEQKETTIKDSDAFRWLHKAVHKVTQDIESFKFNTAISALMEYVNYLSAAEKATRQEFIVLVILLSPFAPHLSEELWQKLHGRTEKEFSKEHSVTVQPWPTYDESKLEEDAFILVVMVNGKKRDEMKLPKEATPDYIKKAVFESDKVKKWTEGKEIKMEKYVPEKIYTIVVQ